MTSSRKVLDEWFVFVLQWRLQKRNDIFEARSQWPVISCDWPICVWFFFQTSNSCSNCGSSKYAFIKSITTRVGDEFSFTWIISVSERKYYMVSVSCVFNYQSFFIKVILSVLNTFMRFYMFVFLLTFWYFCWARLALTG